MGRNGKTDDRGGQDIRMRWRKIEELGGGSGVEGRNARMDQKGAIPCLHGNRGGYEESGRWGREKGRPAHERSMNGEYEIEREGGARRVKCPSTSSDQRGERAQKKEVSTIVGNPKTQSPKFEEHH